MQQHLPAESTESITICSTEIVDVQEDGGGSATTTKVAFNVLNTILGSGILCLPYALHNAGFFFGLAMLCAVALMSQFGLYVLIVTGKRTGTAHFSTVAHAALGSFGYRVLNASMIFDMVGTVVLYLMLVGDLATSLVKVYFPTTSLTRATVILVISTTLVLPQLFFRNTGPLARLSILAVLCLPYIILVVAIRAPLYSDTKIPDLTFFGPRVLPAIGVLAFTYSSCHAAFPNYLGLKDRSVRSWVRASSSATLGASAISIAFALVGFLSFGGSANPNIFANFPASDNHINLARLLFTISLLLTTPLGFYPIRDTFTEMLKIDPSRYNVNRGWEVLCTLVVFAFCVVAAALCTDLGLAYELIGTLTCSIINFVLPALIYLWAGTDISFTAIVRKWRRPDCLQPAENVPLLLAEPCGKPPASHISFRNVLLWAIAWAVVVFGLWIMVLGTYITIGLGS
ncbi:hypothetical protein GGI11_003963 [Coemansia sp. RSA 2049]|nr:hypothetical protein GGI11_003963 [Coemansia sp. RSA 2049]KAJ2515270.1 hypothetical protein H4217_005280 [Coemansia sp. RSA 1939]KAJ2595420.1 hypothetical protein EV177_008144 [Coemansia sp. RSA 1804]KAJ2687339.1 hypothetical protein GGH99_003277 [Coemansia sp. RSA 1285]